MTIETDVAIIGAGSAGLSTAKALREKGIAFQVVEGSHRIGGRAYSEEIAPGVWFDLGCSYLHLGDANPFKDIAASLDIPLCHERADMFSDENLNAWDNGRRLEGAALKAFLDYRDANEASIAASVARGEDRAIVDLIDMESEFAPSYINGLASLNTLDVDETSAKDYLDFGAGYEGRHLDIPVPDGYGNLVKAWGADVPVTLNAKVEEIDFTGPGVTIKTAKGDLKAKLAVITVSTGILAAGDIKFTPALPSEKLDAARGLPCGTENKICVHFDTDVFGADGTGYHRTWTDDDEPSGFEASVMGLNTAIVFTGGRHAIWLERQGQQAGHDYAVNQIANVFGNDIRNHITRSIVTAWTTEPWTRGSYSCALPGQAYQRETMKQSVEERLFFAGEATAIGVNSTCHGAYLSGLRVAEEIIAALAQK